MRDGMAVLADEPEQDMRMMIVKLCDEDARNIAALDIKVTAIGRLLADHKPKRAIRQFIDTNQLIDRIGFSKMSIWRFEAAGTFPKHVRMGGKNVWDVEEIEAWIENHWKDRS